ncbi:MAG: hypothetical protein Kow0092_16040 [Deferrisomatales bacterium]
MQTLVLRTENEAPTTLSRSRRRYIHMGGICIRSHAGCQGQTGGPGAGTGTVDGPGAGAVSLRRPSSPPRAGGAASSSARPAGGAGPWESEPWDGLAREERRWGERMQRAPAARVDGRKDGAQNGCPRGRSSCCSSWVSRGGGDVAAVGIAGGGRGGSPGERPGER